MILVLFDAETDRAWWSHLQAWSEEQTRDTLFSSGGSVTVRIPPGQRLNRYAIGKFDRMRSAVIRQMFGRISYHE